MSRLAPYFKNLQEAITAKDLDKTRQTYADLNNTWTRNEAVVEITAQPTMAKIRTAISLLRSSIETRSLLILPTSSPLMMTSKWD